MAPDGTDHRLDNNNNIGGGNDNNNKTKKFSSFTVLFRPNRLPLPF